MADDAALIDLARAGHEAAFTALVTPLHRELHVHCYRMPGSFDDAADALQETLPAAWRGVGTFGARSSARTWLYRIATNTCPAGHQVPRRRRPDGRPFRICLGFAVLLLPR